MPVSDLHRLIIQLWGYSVCEPDTTACTPHLEICIGQSKERIFHPIILVIRNLLWQVDMSNELWATRQALTGFSRPYSLLPHKHWAASDWLIASQGLSASNQTNTGSCLQTFSCNPVKCASYKTSKTRVMQLLNMFSYLENLLMIRGTG